LKNMMEREKLLQNIRETGFALVDIGLYLNTHPKDEKAMDYFNKYQQINKELRREYAKYCGPLTMKDVDTNDGWTWTKDPWPWEGGCK